MQVQALSRPLNTKRNKLISCLKLNVEHTDTKTTQTAFIRGRHVAIISAVRQAIATTNAIRSMHTFYLQCVEFILIYELFI